MSHDHVHDHDHESEGLRGELHDRGYRMTPQRRLVLDAVSAGLLALVALAVTAGSARAVAALYRDES